MDRQIIIVMLLLLANKNRDKELFNLHTISDYIQQIQIDSSYTQDKIQVLKKIVPYLPEEHISTITASVHFTEKLIKLYDAMDYIQTLNVDQVVEAIPVKDNKERINHILHIVRKELPTSNTNNLGSFMDLILNMDKYQQTFKLMTSIMHNQGNIKDPNQLINMMLPLLGGDDLESQNKMKEMAKMMDILKVLDQPSKTKTAKE